MSLIQINVLKGQQLKSQKRKNMMKNKILIPFKYLTMMVMALSLTLLTFCSDDDDIDKDDPGTGNVGDTTTVIDTTTTVVIDTLSGNPMEGVWKLAPVAGAIALGPNPDDLSWYSNSTEDVTGRDCLFDDRYIFDAGTESTNEAGDTLWTGAYEILTDGSTWLEAWQGATVEGGNCGTPVAPHDESNAPFTYEVNISAGTVTLNGVGAYFGLAKVFNGAELADPANAPVSITYTHVDHDGAENLEKFQITVENDAATDGVNATWQFTLENQEGLDPIDPQDGLNIIESLRAAGGYDTLLYLIEYYAVDAQGTKLIDVLATEGPFTLFAPNNDAFAALYDVVGVTKAADVSPAIIAQLLAYHGAGGQFDALVPGDSIMTVQGEYIKINDGTTAASDGTIPEVGTLLTGSNTKNIIVADTALVTNNGVIYNVATVLIPPSVGAQLAAILQTNAASLLISDGLSIMGSAVRAADEFAIQAGLPSLVAYLSNRDVKSTVFAIPNTVFQAAGLGVETFSPQEWYGLISHHVVSGGDAYQATDGQDSVLYAEYLVAGEFATTGKSVSSMLLARNETGEVIKDANGGDVHAQLHIQYLQGAGSYSSVFIDSDGHAGLGYTAADAGFFNAEVYAADFQPNTNGVVHLIAGYLAPSFDCGNPGLGCYANFSGVFEGTTYDAATSTFNFPSSAVSYAGFANTNTTLYPFNFPYGGKITFTASVPNGDVGVYFKFEKDVYPDVTPLIHTDTVTVTGSTDATYTIEFSGSPVSSDTYKSFLMYLATKDTDVIIKDIYVAASGDGTGPEGPEGNPMAGTWKLAPVAGALALGPNANDFSWWSNSLADVTTRDCLFDDQYIFDAGTESTNEAGDTLWTGTYEILTDGSTWLEAWQGATVDGGNCGTPVAPHDESNAPFTYQVNISAGTVTLNGVGAYFGLAKVFNGAELADPANAPVSITYTHVDDDGAENLEKFQITVENTAATDGVNATWQFTLEHQEGN